MAKTLLDVGNCYADHSALSSLVGDHFDAEVVWVHDFKEAIDTLASRSIDLVLVNRVLDRDGSQGLTLIKEIVADERFGDLPVMMVTNFADHQQAAQEAGAQPGFGKRGLHSPETIERLGQYLGT